MQQIKAYTNYQEFWNFAKSILLQHEAQNNLALGIALCARHKPEQLKHCAKRVIPTLRR